MEMKEQILKAMKKEGTPLNAGRIAELTGLDRKVVDTGFFAGGFRLGRLRALIILNQREVNRTVGQMAREMIARLARFHFAKAEHLLIKFGGFFEVFNFKGEMHDTVHGCSCVCGCCIDEKSRHVH